METQPLFDHFGCTVLGYGQSFVDLAPADVHAAVREHGAVLFRGFTSEPETFEAFTRTQCDLFYFHPHPKRTSLGSDGFSDLAPPGHHAIKLHTERAYEPAFARPQLLWFHCIRAANAGGETLLCDGVELWSRLPSRIQELFTRNRLLYVLPLPSRLLRAQWSRHFVTSAHKDISRDDAEQIMRADPNVEYAFLDHGKLLVLKHLVPAVMASRFNGRLAFSNNLLNRRFSSFVQFEDYSTVEEELLCEVDAIAAPITYPLTWEAGDVLLVDNERVLHGRHAHNDPMREIHVRFGRDRFVARHPDGRGLTHLSPEAPATVSTPPAEAVTSK
jgi:alpha-ketoglutarate-dependent taurine dioxygenase